jgi:hypothetical protein
MKHALPHERPYTTPPRSMSRNLDGERRLEGTPRGGWAGSKLMGRDDDGTAIAVLCFWAYFRTRSWPVVQMSRALIFFSGRGVSGPRCVSGIGAEIRCILYVLHICRSAAAMPRFERAGRRILPAAPDQAAILPA